MKDGTKDNLSESTFLGQLPQEKWDRILMAVEHQVLPPHTVIFSQGDPGNKFYIIQSGKVRVFRKGSRGLETELSMLGAGESFGEMALLTGEMRSAHVETLEETRLMVLSKESFEAVLKDFPDITLAFLKQMSGWMLRKDRIIEKEARQEYLAPRATWFDFLLVIGIALILALVSNQSNPNGIPLFPKFPDRSTIPRISAANAMAEFKKGTALFVDAGPEGFYQSKHIQGAISVPLPLFDVLYDVTFAEEGKAKKVIVYGGTFSRLYDWELASRLLLKGHEGVRVLEGGAAAWEKAGYPLARWKGEE
jgi:rhodanese-related sulfurtransferase